MAGGPAPGARGAIRRFRAICVAVVPEAAALDEPEWRELEAIVARALATRPPRVRRQLAVFMRLLDVIALARTRRTLSGLAPHARWELLDALSKSRSLLLRRGVWGLRTLVFMGYYARPRAALAIGYRASPSGWSARAGVASMP
jgi:hypothetical protein